MLPNETRTASRTGPIVSVLRIPCDGSPNVLVKIQVWLHGDGEPGTEDVLEELDFDKEFPGGEGRAMSVERLGEGVMPEGVEGRYCAFSYDTQYFLDGKPLRANLAAEKSGFGVCYGDVYVARLRPPFTKKPHASFWTDVSPVLEKIPLCLRKP